MKFIILASIIFSSAVFAYNTHTVGNDPEGTRDPSSIIEKPKK